MNFFNNIILHKNEEVFEDLLKSETTRIERIVSFGQSSEDGFWYDQEENEWVMILEGEAIVEFENYDVKLNLFDYLFIPKHQKHRVKWTIPEKRTVWMAVFFV